MRGIRRLITTAAFIALVVLPVVAAASWASMPSSRPAVAIDQPATPPEGRTPGILAVVGSGLLVLAFVLGARTN